MTVDAHEPVVASRAGVPIWERLGAMARRQGRNVKNLSGLVIFNFLASGLFFITQIKLANVLGKEQFGMLAYGIAIGMYGMNLVYYGMDRSLVRDLVQHPGAFAEVVLGSLLWRWGLFVLTLTGLLIWKLGFAGAEITWGVLCVIVAYALRALDLQGAYDAWHEMSRHAWYNALQRLLHFAIIWGVLWLYPRWITLEFVGGSLLATQTVYLVLQQSWAFRRMPRDGIDWSAVARRAWTMAGGGYWLYLGTLAGLTFSALSQIMLKHYAGAAELGGFAAAWQLTMVATLLITQVARVGGPVMASITRPEVGFTRRLSLIVKYSAFLALLVLPICALCFLAPRAILGLFFRAEYGDAAQVMRVLSIYTLLLSLGSISAQYLISARLEFAYLLCVLVSGVLSVVLAMTLIPRYGGVGAALVLLCAHGLAMLLYTVVMYVHLWRSRAMSGPGEVVPTPDLTEIHHA